MWQLSLLLLLLSVQSSVVCCGAIRAASPPTGVPSRTNCFIMPTVNCLVELTEMPFTVTTLSGRRG